MGGGGALRIGARVLGDFFSRVPNPAGEAYGGGLAGVGGGVAIEATVRRERTGGVGLVQFRYMDIIYTK